MSISRTERPTSMLYDVQDQEYESGGVCYNQNTGEYLNSDSLMFLQGIVVESHIHQFVLLVSFEQASSSYGSKRKAAILPVTCPSHSLFTGVSLPFAP
jgi:hypothetical protein